MSLHHFSLDGWRVSVPYVPFIPLLLFSYLGSIFDSVLWYQFSLSSPLLLGLTYAPKVSSVPKLDSGRDERVVVRSEELGSLYRRQVSKHSEQPHDKPRLGLPVHFPFALPSFSCVTILLLLCPCLLPPFLTGLWSLLGYVVLVQSFDPFDIIFRIVLIYACIAVGVFLKRYVFPDNPLPAKVLTQILIFTVFPFLILSAILGADLTSGRVLFFSVGFALAVIITGLVSVWLYTRWRPLPPAIRGAAMMAAGFPNAVFLPFPLIIMLVGVEGLVTATIFAVTFVFVQNSVGSWVSVRYGSGATNGGTSAREVVLKLASFPPAIILVVGVLVELLWQPVSLLDALSFLPVPDSSLGLALDALQWVSLVLALVVVGLTFEFNLSALEGIHLVPVSVARFFVAPLVSFGVMVLLVLALGPPDLRTEVLPLLIQGLSGPAVANIAFAKQFGLDVSAESTYITVLTLVALALLVPVLLVVLSFV